MNKIAANPKNEALARKLRARAAKLGDAELRARAERVAAMVENADREAPGSLLNLVFRKPTAAEMSRGVELEAMARKLLSGHGQSVT